MDRKESQKNRLIAWFKYKDWLDINMKNSSGSQRGWKQWSYYRLLYLKDALFETEDEEYEAIGKFGRNQLWNTELIEKGFKVADRKTYIGFAREFGAFDY